MTVSSCNPHDPADVVGSWPEAGPAGVAAAVRRAVDAATSWRAEPAAVRGAALTVCATALEERAEEVAQLMVREVGKPIQEARAEVARGVAILRFDAALPLLADGETLPASQPAPLLMVRRRPLGVVGCITPWNFPVAIPLWKVAPAIAMGNAAILKPAGAATAVATCLWACLGQHLPAGVLQVLTGEAETGAALAAHPEVAAISFTGSVAVGRSVVGVAAGRGARVQAEMGGQNPSVVLADADLDRAATTIAAAAMGYAGQKCTATSRVIVEAPVFTAFRERLIAAVTALKVVDPADERTVVGPVISAAARDRALDAIARQPGRVLTGGAALDAPGSYLAPTLVELDGPTGPLAEEEVFAPVAAILRADSAEAAVALANRSRYGLAAALFTRDLGRALQLAPDLAAGMVRVNAPTTGVDYHAPFGGTRDSSYGPREQGLAARDFYTESRTILIAP